LCEHLGEDCLIYCSLVNSNEKIIVSTSLKNKVKEGEIISLSFDEASIYLFSKDDEGALF
ncbi:MAG: hypothetical protein ACI4UG_02540, partial [Candidatus Onthovivens sp.]